MFVKGNVYVSALKILCLGQGITDFARSKELERRIASAKTITASGARGALILVNFFELFFTYLFYESKNFGSQCTHKMSMKSPLHDVFLFAFYGF